MSGLTKFFVAMAGTALFNVGTVAQAATIDTTAGWLGGGYIFGGSRFGQVFTVPSDNVLDSFTFFLSSVGSPPTEFTGRLASWEPITFESGTDIYSSASQSVAGLPLYTGTPSGYGEITFNTGRISLVAGQQYVAYLNVEVMDWARLDITLIKTLIRKDMVFFTALLKVFGIMPGVPMTMHSKRLFLQLLQAFQNPL
jgi:hypothetical protein